MRVLKDKYHIIKAKFNKMWLPYLLIAPAAIIIVVFLIMPIFYAFYCSLYRCDYMNFTRFIGMDNYINVLSRSDILKTIWLTLKISFIGLALALIFGVLLAVWINKAKGVFAYILQLIVLIPWITSMIVSTLLWKWLLQNDLGLINYFLQKTGLNKIGFLTDEKVVVWTLIFVMTWRVIAYVMIQILAGLKTISDDYVEAAMIDGANGWKIFWTIKVPMLKTPITLSCIIVALSNINNVIVPLTLTGGGPGTATNVLAIEVYRQSFTYYHFGESSALSILMCLFNFILIIFYIKAVKYEKR